MVDSIGRSLLVARSIFRGKKVIISLSFVFLEVFLHYSVLYYYSSKVEPSPINSEK